MYRVTNVYVVCSIAALGKYLARPPPLDMVREPNGDG